MDLDPALLPPGDSHKGLPRSQSPCLSHSEHAWYVWAAALQLLRFGQRGLHALFHSGYCFQILPITEITEEGTGAQKNQCAISVVTPLKV